MKTKSVGKNIVHNIIYQVFALALPLITMPYVSRVLGSDQIGQFSYDSAMVNYFTIFAVLGTSTYGQRTIAFHKDNKSERSVQFWNTFFFRLITSAVAISFYIGYTFIFLGGGTLLSWMVALYILNVATDITWYFQGVEDFKKTVIRGLIIKILSFIAVFVFVRSASHTWIYALITCGSLVLGNLVMWVGFWKYVEKPKNVRPFTDIKDIFLMFLPTIASQVYTVMDRSMIGWITNDKDAIGNYEQAEKLVRAALSAVTAVSAVVLSRVANLYKSERTEEAKGYIYKAYRIVWAMSFPIMLGFCSVASIFIPLYLGGGYGLAVTLMIIFSPLVVFIGLASVTGISYLVPTKQQNVYTVSVTISAVVNVILNLILMLALNMGAVGAAIASVAAEFLGAAIQIGYCVQKKQLSLKKIFAPAVNYLLASLVMLGCVLVVQHFISNNIVSLAVSIGTGVGVYCIMLLILQDELVFELLKKLKRGKGAPSQGEPSPDGDAANRETADQVEEDGI